MWAQTRLARFHEINSMRISTSVRIFVVLTNIRPKQARTFNILSSSLKTERTKQTIQASFFLFRDVNVLRKKYVDTIKLSMKMTDRRKRKIDFSFRQTIRENYQLRLSDKNRIPKLICEKTHTRWLMYVSRYTCVRNDRWSSLEWSTILPSRITFVRIIEARAWYCCAACKNDKEPS